MILSTYLERMRNWFKNKHRITHMPRSDFKSYIGMNVDKAVEMLRADKSLGRGIIRKCAEEIPYTNGTFEVILVRFSSTTNLVTRVGPAYLVKK